MSELQENISLLQSNAVDLAKRVKDINSIYFSFCYLSFENEAICFQIDMVLLEDFFFKVMKTGWMPDTRWSDMLTGHRHLIVTV